MPRLTSRPSPLRLRQDGFTLAELAVVLIIIAVLAGGLLAPLGARVEERKRRETLDSLEAIESALIGFAAINGRLPCPTTEADPAGAGYGQEDSAACGATAEGYLPWRTLGLSPYDAWGTPRTGPGSPWTGYWRYRVDAAFGSGALVTAATTPADNLQIHDRAGNTLTLASPSTVVAIVYSTGPNLQPDGRNAVFDGDYEAGEAGGGFDDLVVWLGRPLLIARLAQAGRL